MNLAITVTAFSGSLDSRSALVRPTTPALIPVCKSVSPTILLLRVKRNCGKKEKGAERKKLAREPRWGSSSTETELSRELQEVPTCLRGKPEFPGRVDLVDEWYRSSCFQKNQLLDEELSGGTGPY